MKRLVPFPFFAVVASFVCPALADTVLWHHFDERAPGDAAQATDVLTNAVSASYGSGAPYSIDAGTTPGSDPDFMPKYEKPFFAENIYDPVTGTVHTNRSSVGFRTEGTSAALKGGMVRIDTSEELKLTNFTVECFVCTTGGTFNTIAPIVGKPNGNFLSESWQIGMLTNGKLFMRFNRQNSNPSVGTGSHFISDGVWHHVAMTCSYDEETDMSTYAMYVDYQLDFTEELAGVTGYGNGDLCAVYVGGYLHAGRKFNGAVDELRIMDVALTPDQFLRCAPSDVVDEDTLLWLPFDGSPGSPVIDRMLNKVQEFDENGTLSSKVVTSVKSGDVPDMAFSSDVIAPTVRSDPSKPPQTRNVASMCLQTNGTFGAGSALMIPAYPYCATNLTIEFFFKTAGKIKAGESQTLFKFGTGPLLQVTLDNTAPGRIVFVYKNKAGGIDLPLGEWTSAGGTTHGSDLDDGGWHHVAVVYDADGTRLSLYIDHTRVWSSGEVLLADVSSQIFFGSKEGASGQFFHGWLDSIRVTRRALGRSEFLSATTKVFRGPQDVMFHASFDGDYEAVSPGFTVRGYGEARGYDGCKAPELTNEVKYAELLLDGGEGLNSVTNSGSLYLDGSIVNFPSVGEMGDYDQTAEFFCRLSHLGDMAGLMRVNNNYSNPTFAPIWALYANEGASHYLKFRCSMAVDGIQDAECYLSTTVPTDVLTDDEWHHVAVTFEYEEDADRERVSLYIDGEKKWSGTLPGKLSAAGTGHCVAIGASVREDGNVVGFFDEMRITRGVLTPDMFLCRYRRPRGTVLTFR